MFPFTEPTTGQLIILFLISTVFAFLCAYYAEKKARNPIIWFILGFLFSFYALVVLFFLSSIKNEEEKQPTMTILPPDPDLKDKETIYPLSTFEKYKEENQLWFYLDEDHQQTGPVSLIALRDLWNRGLLLINQYVWSEGMTKWEKIQDLPDLIIALGRVTD